MYGGTSNSLPSMSTKASSFFEELAHQVVALVQEAVEEYVKQLQRQILAEQKISAKLRDEVEQFRKQGRSLSSSNGAACQITMKVGSPSPLPVLAGDITLPNSQLPTIMGDDGLLHDDALHYEPSAVHLRSDGTEVSSRKTPKAPPQQESLKLIESMTKTFRQLDKRNVGHLCANDLKNLVQLQSSEDAQALEERISRTIEAVNRAQLELCAESMNVSELSYQGFKYIMFADLDDNSFGYEVLLTLRNLREGCLSSTTERMVADGMSLNRQDTFRKNFWVRERFLAPLSAIVISVNALCIGLSLDVATEWLGWQIMEICCVAFFLMELLATLFLSGFVEAYFGDEWKWNLFDTIVVVFALVDACLWALDEMGVSSQEVGESLSTVSILRLARLVRVTRVMRLLKLNFSLFKDLKIMIKGIKGGLNTLCWSSVFLVGMIYVVGIIMRMLMQNLNMDCSLDNSNCSPSERALVKDYGKLFSSTPRCMFTVLRCLTDGCSAADGTPLALHFWDWSGVLFIICYSMLFFFVIFVMFNLISAVFVEKTLEYAKQDTDKRRYARNKEDRRVARELKEVILKICTYKKRTQPKDSNLTTAQYNMAVMLKAVGFKQRSGTLDMEGLDLNGSRLSVSKSEFQTIFEEKEIKPLLRDLDISVANSSKLFDILDANQDGIVDIGELADGFLSLRGPANKGDIVSISLMVKAIQKSMAQVQAGQEELRQLVLEILGR